MTTTSDIRVTTTAEWEEYKEKPANWTFNVPEIRNRTELARVLDVTNERDFNDQPNKKVELSIPTLSRFPISFYIGREQIAELKPGDDKKDKYGQTCYVTLGRSTLREGKDSSLDYNYKWYLNGWNVDPAQVTQRPDEDSPRTTPTPAITSSAGKSDDIDKLFDGVGQPFAKSSPNEIPLWTNNVEQRIAWNSGVNNAVAYLSANPLIDKEGTHIRYDDPLWDTEFNYLAHKLYAIIANGPDLDRWMPFIVDEPEEPATEPATESEGDGFPGGLG